MALAKRQEAKKKKHSVERAHEAKHFALQSKLARLLFRYKDSKRRIALYQNTLVPKANESLETTYTAFEAEKASFLDLLEAERSLLDFKLSLARALADRHISAANIAALLGTYSELGSSKKEGGQQ